MPAWLWVIIWVLLSIIGAGFLLLILWQLKNKALAIVAELGELTESLENLSNIAASKQPAADFHSAIDDNPAKHLITLRDNKRDKAQRKQARARRLIRRLNARKQD